MKNAEKLLIEFSTFFAENISTYIKTVNEENSGGIQIEDFYSIGIFGNSHRTLPFVTVSLEQAELTEKDRIIENEVYFLEMKLHLQETLDNAEQRKMHYVRAVCLFFEEYEFCDLWQMAKITEFKKNSIFIRVEL